MIMMILNRVFIMMIVHRCDGCRSRTSTSSIITCDILYHLLLLFHWRLKAIVLSILTPFSTVFYLFCCWFSSLSWMLEFVFCFVRVVEQCNLYLYHHHWTHTHYGVHCIDYIWRCKEMLVCHCCCSSSLNWLPNIDQNRRFIL